MSCCVSPGKAKAPAQAELYGGIELEYLTAAYSTTDVLPKTWTVDSGSLSIERLWRSVKYECLYLHPADDGQQVFAQLEAYFVWYNHHRPHQRLNGQTPASIYQIKSYKQPSAIQ